MPLVAFLLRDERDEKDERDDNEVGHHIFLVVVFSVVSFVRASLCCLCVSSSLLSLLTALLSVVRASPCCLCVSFLSFELRFTAGLNFEATGERVPFALLHERSDEPDDRVELARAMRDEGKTLQQIANELGYKSISSVHTLLNRS